MLSSYCSWEWLVLTQKQAYPFYQTCSFFLSHAHAYLQNTAISPVLVPVALWVQIAFLFNNEDENYCLPRSSLNSNNNVTQKFSRPPDLTFVASLPWLKNNTVRADSCQWHNIFFFFKAQKGKICCGRRCCCLNSFLLKSTAKMCYFKIDFSFSANWVRKRG